MSRKFLKIIFAFNINVIFHKLNMPKKINLLVKVTPNAKQNSVTKEEDLFGNIIYKIKTTQTAEEGKANKSVIDLIACYFKTAKSKVKILKGLTSRDKLIEVIL